MVSGRKRTPLEERFWAKIDKRDECWIWIGATRSGYGVIGSGGHGGRILYTHRLSWEFHFGPIPDGLWVLHHCDNRPCVRPNHLFLGTVADNNADRHAKGRTKITHHSGETNGSAKLSEEDVRIIRGLLREGVSQSEVGRRYGVTSQNIGFIARGKTWVGVT